MAWDPNDLPSQTGKTIVVTGGAGGIGYFVSEQLAGAGARVILAARSAERADAAAQLIRSRAPHATVEHLSLDLASLASIREAASRLADLGPVDVLINNAGITNPSKTRQTTADGLELVLGTNHFGAFALTALLYPGLPDGARVIGLGSLSTRLAKANLDDLQQEHGRYNRSLAYASSKHAVHGFALELDRRLRAAISPVVSLLAHPGFSVDGLSPSRPGVTDRHSGGQDFAEKLLAPMAQGKDRGAWPIVRAAIDPAASGGEFWGPKHLTRGVPELARPVAQSAEPAFGARLWSLSEQATGISFDVNR